MSVAKIKNLKFQKFATKETTAKLLKLEQLQSRLGSSNMGQDSLAKSPWTGCSQFLPTTQKIIQFSDGKSPNPNDKIVITTCILF